ncbi:MAG: hypothetical protein FJ387_23485 [Verrucomicrobia bacterium]|nr:hypothetical protein [Verrucomicrobiota bacterium]
MRTWAAAPAGGRALGLTVSDLPRGAAPVPVALPHFPTRLQALIWRNWQLVPLERLAAVVGATPAELRRLGRAMGLAGPPRLTLDQQRRSALTVIRRNWHLLPYAQLLELLGWTPEQMAFTLREDDFLFIKLGSLKPECAPIRYAPLDGEQLERTAALRRVVREEFPAGLGRTREALFEFVGRLAAPPPAAPARRRVARLSPRFCYSYFALYGDPLLEPELDPYPDGYLARLAEAGVDGVWLAAVLYQLAPFPWALDLSARAEERLANLRRLVARARRRGLGLWLYLNEPRAMPLRFFEGRPGLKGVVEGDHATLCTSQPEVQRYLRNAVSTILRAVPDLAGFFTITGSENLTNCWSHGGGASCPRCGSRGAAEVIGELNRTFYEGIQQASGRVEGAEGGAVRVQVRSAGDARSGVAERRAMRAQLMVWDWGWAEGWVEGILDRLPAEVGLLSVSEWDLPIERGGIRTTIGEYSISAIGPGPRARRHWQWARARGLRTLAKIQAGNTWELSAVPYIPAVENVARHAARLQAAGVDGLMLGWTLGGYPSPNLEVVAEVVGAVGEGEPGRAPGTDPLGSADATEQQVGVALLNVATRRFGKALAPVVVQAWRALSAAFGEFPYHGGVVYNAPMQYGPANLLWGEPTGYRATMVGFPYDDLDGWRQVYPAEVFGAQFEKVADGFERAVAELQRHAEGWRGPLEASHRANLEGELRVAEAAALHFRSTANQVRFVQARRRLSGATSGAEGLAACGEIEWVLRAELAAARRLHELQSGDSRLGFEASNQYFYVPLDLAEKAINCRDLLDRWLPSQRERWRP